MQALRGLFKRLTTKAPDSVIGVDIGSSAIKVVQLKRKRGVALLETYGEIALGPYVDTDIGRAVQLTPEQAAGALLDVMREANVTSRIGGISIPFMSSLVTMIRLPALPSRELEDMIPIEARKYVPVPISEVSLDWFVLPEGDEQLLGAGEPPSALKDQEEKKKNDDEKGNLSSAYTNVLLVAIHNEVLAAYKTIVTRANLDVSFFEIEIFSAIRAAMGQTLAPAGVLDVGAAKTKLYIVEYGIVKSSHLINRGSQDITLALSRALSIDVGHAEELKRTEGLETGDKEAKEAMELTLSHIFSEVNRALLSYQRKTGRNVGSVTLTGGGAVLKGLLPVASQKLDTEVTLGDPFAKVETPAFLADLLKQVGPEFSVAVGLALRKLQDDA